MSPWRLPNPDVDLRVRHAPPASVPRRAMAAEAPLNSTPNVGPEDPPPGDQTLPCPSGLGRPASCARRRGDVEPPPRFSDRAAIRSAGPLVRVERRGAVFR